MQRKSIPSNIKKWREKRNSIVCRLLRDNASLTGYQALKQANRIMQENKNKIKVTDTPFKKFGAYVERDEILKQLGFASYQAYLVSPLWHNIRYSRLKENPNCLICSCTATEVHHTHYTIDVLEKGSYKCLAPLCGKCHREIEYYNGRKRTRFNANRVLFIAIRRRGKNGDSAGRTWLETWKKDVIKNKKERKS